MTQEKKDQILRNLAHFTGTENYFPIYPKLFITDGANYMADACGAFWLFDVIYSYQTHLKGEYFQVWTLEVDPREQSAIVICDDGDGKRFVTQKIKYTDFPFDNMKLYCSMADEENKVIFLPSEY